LASIEYFYKLQNSSSILKRRDVQYHPLDLIVPGCEADEPEVVKLEASSSQGDQRLVA
jgi:hypothetical protein